MSGKPDGYVEVSERIVKFYEAYPDGRLTTESVAMNLDPDGVPRVWVGAAAYRTADDPHPGRGWSYMAVPGSTNFTRGSELENTETSAWGRAMAAVGIEVKRGIASAQEVRNKEGSTTSPRPVASSPAGAHDTAQAATAGPWEGAVTAGKAPVDLSLRETAGGKVFGFVLLEEVPGGKYPRKTQVVCEGPLADAVATAVAGMGTPESATVWGDVEMVPWQKDGQDMRPFRKVHATRVMTPEWTIPATDATPTENAAPGGSTEPVDDLADLPW